MASEASLMPGGPKSLFGATVILLWLGVLVMSIIDLAAGPTDAFYFGLPYFIIATSSATSWWFISRTD